MRYPTDMTYLSLALCFIPLVALYLCLALLVPGFKKLTGLWACVLGLLALIPAEIFLMFVGTELHYTSLLRTLLNCVLLALIEESIKMLLLFLLPAKKTSLSVFFSYAVLCGMVLACFEAFVYLVQRNALWRYSATLIHVFCSGLSGLFVYSVRKKNLHLTPFVFAVLFHGVYNYFAGIPDFRHYFAFAVIVIAVLECRLRYAFLKDDIEKLSVIKFDSNIEEKGENLKMGKIADWFKGLFGGKKQDAEPSLPEKTVFGKDADAVSANEGAAEETLAADTPTSDSSAVENVISETSDEVKTGFSEYPEVKNLFDDEPPKDDIEPKTDLFTSEIDSKLAELEQKVAPVLEDSVKSLKADEPEKKTTRRRVSTKSSDTAATTTKRTRKTSAEKEPAEKKTATRKTSTAKSSTAKTTRKSASASDESATKTSTRKTSSKSATSKTATEKASAKTASAKSTESKSKTSASKAASTTKKASTKAEADATTAKKRVGRPSTKKSETGDKTAAETKTKRTTSTTTKKTATEKKPAEKKSTTKKTSSTTKSTKKS